VDLSTAFSVHFLCFIKLRDAKSKCIDSSFKMWEIRFFAQLAEEVKLPLKQHCPRLACFLFNMSYVLRSAGAPNNHDIAMVIAL